MATPESNPPSPPKREIPNEPNCAGQPKGTQKDVPFEANRNEPNFSPAAAPLLVSPRLGASAVKQSPKSRYTERNPMDPKQDGKPLDRRDFLIGSSLAAGLVFGATPISAAKPSSNEVRVALLGAGAQGQVLLDACLQIPNVRFRAVCDIWTEYNQRRVSRLLKDGGHANNVYVDYREMLDKEKGNLDAVLIATPDFWHAEHAIACMKAGLEVYCEKEMSNSLADARRMVETSRQTGRLLQIGHQRRSNPRYLF